MNEEHWHSHGAIHLPESNETSKIGGNNHTSVLMENSNYDQLLVVKSFAKFLLSARNNDQTLPLSNGVGCRSAAPGLPTEATDPNEGVY
jgi:hypothetical protein